MDNKVIYVGEYDILREGKQKRMWSLATSKKMDYIVRVLNTIGYQVDIISYAQVSRGIDECTWTKRERLSSGCTLVLVPPCFANNLFRKIMRKVKTNWWLFSYLCRNCKRDDTVLVYHSYQPAIPIFVAQHLKRFRVLLEVEEQYSMVWKLSPWQRLKERIMLNYAKDSALVVSEVLAQRLGIKKPIVSYGSYRTYKGNLSMRQNSNEVKTLVYTGSIDKTKGSAFIACKMMQYLGNDYILRISGPVTSNDSLEFFALIEQINKEKGYESIKYLGVLGDEEYQELLLNADIALNPQKEGGFGSFLFPSKILTYMSYGLPVVSTKGESIVNSQVSDLITFAEDFSPKSVADAVVSVGKTNASEYLERLSQLDRVFCEKLKTEVS